MKSERATKKKKGGAARTLLPVVALLIVALVTVAMLYLRSQDEAPEPSAPEDSPAVDVVSATPVPDEPTPEPVPYQPVHLYLDLNGSDEALDIAVCDSEGLAVPGYAFPLEIRYQDGSSYTVQSDINGHYYAEYIFPGQYTVSMPPLDGFSAAESVSCSVRQKSDFAANEDMGRFGDGK